MSSILYFSFRILVSCLKYTQLLQTHQLNQFLCKPPLQIYQLIHEGLDFYEFRRYLEDFVEPEIILGDSVLRGLQQGHTKQ